jgi:enterochelin esterase family protein
MFMNHRGVRRFPWSVRPVLCTGVFALALAAAMPASGQNPPPAPAPAPAPTAPQVPRFTPPPQFVSPEVATDGRITFRIYAPNAKAIRLSAGDIPGMMGPAAPQFTKAENGVWEATIGPIGPGAYRYTLNVDGVATVDPRNAVISESNTSVSSLVIVPGSDAFDTKDVPHGAVASIVYKSTVLGMFRRMQIYTPPGYENGVARYPVFYLLHGAGDNDNAWPTVGRAGIILDNLIAAKKARPMIVVMPAGHQPRTAGSPIGRSATEAFVNEFVKDVMPYVETHYRVLTDRAHTAIAGLSMGGGQTLAVAIPRLERFAYIGVFSSGLLGAFPELAGRGGRGAMPPAPTPAPPAAPTAPPAPVPTAPPATAPAAPAAPAMPAAMTAADWEKEYASKLDSPALKKGLRLLYFATGKDDFLVTTTEASVAFFKKHGFTPVYNSSAGGHTWINWRDYLVDFAPQLFKPVK